MLLLRLTTHLLALAALAFCFAIVTVTAHAQTALLNVSYDPTRELYRDINREFAATWRAKGGAIPDHSTVSRRIGGAGARGHRRAECGCRDAGARLRHR